MLGRRLSKLAQLSIIDTESAKVWFSAVVIKQCL